MLTLDWAQTSYPAGMDSNSLLSIRAVPGLDWTVQPFDSSHRTSLIPRVPSGPPCSQVLASACRPYTEGLFIPVQENGSECKCLIEAKQWLKDMNIINLGIQISIEYSIPSVQVHAEVYRIVSINSHRNPGSRHYDLHAAGEEERGAQQV